MSTFRKYLYQEYVDYINNAINIIPVTKLDEIKKKLKDNWQPIKGNVSEICNNVKGKSYTGYEDTFKYFQNINTSYPIYKIPKHCENQIVLGQKEYIKDYFNYIETHSSPKFFILTNKNWTENDNNLFVRCGAIGQLNDCKYPIRILLPKNHTELFNNNNYRITLLELLTIKELIDNEIHVKSKESLKNNLWILEDSNLPYDIIFIENPHFVKKGGKTRFKRKHKLTKRKHKTRKYKNSRK